MSLSIDPEIDKALQRYTRLSALLQHISSVTHYHKKVYRTEAPVALFELHDQVEEDIKKVRGYLIARSHSDVEQT